MRARKNRLAHAAVLLLVVGATAWFVGVRAMQPAQALSNGLALTPPMGWNDWNSYGCNVSESLVKQTADKIVSSGLAAAGYQYVNIDDCWLQHNRDGSGNLQPDFTKFPDGISGTASYVHSKGLKLGIYEDAGTATCAGYPGSLGHEAQDARSFASWGVDYLKYDNCNNAGSSTQAQYISRYSAMRDALNATGRKIVYSLCEWGVNQPWTWGAGVGNLWRTTTDINASYSSMLSIFHQNVGLNGFAGPGGWNDPDMLEVGRGMSTTEDQAEFSLWAEMAAPLLAGNNLVTASSATLSILGNKAVIAVDQDSLGRQGRQVSSSGGLDVLAKPLAGGDVSVVLFNENSGTATISTTTAAIGATGSGSYTLTDLWTGATRSTTGTISASVPGHGVVMYRVSGGASASPSASPSVSPSVSPSASPSRSSGGAGQATATYTVTSSWPGGFQGQVTVTAGSAPIGGWTVSWSFPNGQTITQLWNGSYTQSGANVAVSNVSYNGALAAGASATFGFIATSTGTNNPPASLTVTTN